MLTLLDFPPNATHKMCCNMPYLVAIDTIATKLFCGPWDAKGRVALGYCVVVHLVVVLTVKIRQPSHEFSFGVGMSFIPYPLVLTPVV
jgi:hypothetical protein